MIRFEYKKPTKFKISNSALNWALRNKKVTQEWEKSFIFNLTVPGVQQILSGGYKDFFLVDFLSGRQFVTKRLSGKSESKLVKMNEPESRAAVGDRLKLLIRRTSVENLGELGFVRILVAVDLRRRMNQLFRVVALKLLFNFKLQLIELNTVNLSLMLQLSAYRS